MLQQNCGSWQPCSINLKKSKYKALQITTQNHLAHLSVINLKWIEFVGFLLEVFAILPVIACLV